jgi:hypothetical protein
VTWVTVRSKLVQLFTPRRPDWQYVLAVVSVAGALVLLAGSAHHYLTYGTETDFAALFVPEARRFLQGEPLQSTVHPPLYSMVIGLVYLATGDWLRAGLLVSWMAGAVALVSSFLLFKELLNRAAGYGALLGLLASGVFTFYWAQATSDVFFLAGFMVSCLLAVRASRSGSLGLWAACGVAAGLCFFARTNGISLAVLVVAPLLGAGSTRAKGEAVLVVLGGMALPVAALGLYARVTGSNLLPQNTYLDLAVTYFAQRSHRLCGATGPYSERFTSLRDVLLYDPAAMARTYATHLYWLLAEGLTRLIEVPLYYAILPGLIFLIGMDLSPALLVLAVVTVSQALLVSLTYFQPRLYLFLVPWLGAAIGETFRRIAAAPWPRRGQPVVASCLALTVLLSLGGAAGKTLYLILHGQEELSEVVPLARREIEPGASILAFRPQVAYYSHASPEPLPDLVGLAALRDDVEARARQEPLYLFYGEIERACLPQYSGLAVEAPPSWLEVAARSRRPGGWVLLRVE